MTDRGKSADTLMLAADGSAGALSGALSAGLSLPLVLERGAASVAADGAAGDRARRDAGQAAAQDDPAQRLELAVAHVFETLGRPVFRYIRGFVRDAAVARDLTQEVFVRLCTELAAGRHVADPRAWVFRVAHNLAIDEQRRLRTREAHEHSADAADLAFLFPDPSPSAEHELLRRERRDWLRTAMQSLSAQERRCLFLRAQGLRYREIADVLDLRIPTVVTFLTRAIQKLTKARP